MVYVYSKKSQLEKYIGEKLKVSEIEDTLSDMGMDIKGVSDEKDPELKIEVTAERTDMVSTVGIGRAIRYYRGLSKEIVNYKIKKGKNKVIVHKSVKGARPKTVCAIIRNFNLTQELLDEIIEIQEKIHDSFGRNRKKASIGIYPCDEFEFPVTFFGERPEDIKFRPLESDKEMNGLEILKSHETGKKFAHLLKDLKFYPVFRDSKKKVLSMPPIINSHETGRVSLEHKDLFIEISGFNLTYLDNLLKVLVTTFIEMGAECETVQVEYHDSSKYELNLKNRVEKVSLDYVNKLIGTKIKSSEIKKLLAKVMYGLKDVKGNTLSVLVPPFKSDVWNDCDIADDIGRAYGYNNIVPTYPNVSSVGSTLPFSRFKDSISETFVRFGFLELYTYTLSSTENQFAKMNCNESKNHIKLIDSCDQGTNMLRIRVLPEILQSLHINRKNKYPQKVFENGFTIHPDKKIDTKAKDKVHLSCAIADPKTSYTEIKAALDTFAKLHELELEVKELNDCPFLIEGRRAEIFYKKKSVGFIGELHPQVIENFGLLVPVSCFELIISDVFELM